MCFGAIHWAKIPKLYYGCGREDAAHIGFDDKFIYDVIRGTAEKVHVHSAQIDRNECLEAFNEWSKKQDKVNY
jgi:guanine deaminase